MKILKTTKIRNYKDNESIEYHFGLGDNGELYWNWFDYNQNQYVYSWSISPFSLNEMDQIVKEFKHLILFT